MAILMTEQLAKQLIEHYEQCISEVKQCTDIVDIIKICKQYYTDQGLCYCATKVFNQDTYGCKWLTKMANLNSRKIYITVLPDQCNNIPEIISALQTRVDILLTFKNENNGTQ